MKTLFIITSAIHVGQDSENRLVQTMHTVESIKSRFKNAEIWLLDGSNSELSNSYITLLNIDKLYQFYNDDKIIEIKEKAKTLKLPVIEKIIDVYRFNFIKNACESYMLNTIFEKIDTNKYDRVFKISGRYFLTSGFDINKHQKPNTFTLRNGQDSLSGQKYTNSEKYRNCVLWSFDPILLPTIKKTFADIEEYIKSQSERNRLGDIEHGLEIYTPKNIINETQFNGVMGRINNEKIELC